jgi:hypothetical protein
MKYTFISMNPVDAFDCAIKVEATPNAVEELLGRRKRILTYCGSGTTWRLGASGPHCGYLTSEWLHEIWNRELKRRQDAFRTPSAQVS